MLFKKILAIFIIFFLIGISINASEAVENQLYPKSLGKIIYVGGNGEGNYTTIQDAINDSSNGDTVFVYDESSPYNENLVVDKSIILKGENKETTVINGIGHEITVGIYSDNVILSGFTIENYDNTSGQVTGLVSLLSNYNLVYDNIILGGTAWIGVEIFGSEYNIVSNNIITCSFGIDIHYGKNNNISNNLIKDCNDGIHLTWYTNNNTITRNNIINNSWGITSAFFHINDEITFNNITNCYYGILALNCFNFKITNNNFIKNFVNARFGYLFIGAFVFGFQFKSLRYIRSSIKWDGNYWDRPRSIPKPILGRMGPSGRIPWIHFDLNPAEEPYDI
jgi:parallel beta-helix repeat protein